MRPDPSHFRFWHPVDVRFRDIDLGGHAHHSLALVYFEEARAAYWRDVVGQSDLAEIDFILAEARVRYHQRVLYPVRMEVGVRVPSMGKKHFVMEYLARDEAGEALVSGETTMVMFDYQKGTTKRVPPEVRAAVLSLEGENLADGRAD
jgi:acyl-CoA thioester hydrolase